MKRSWPVFLVFLAMGFGDVVGPLVILVKKTFELSNFMAQLVPLTGFLMFGLLSVPMGLVQDRRGKKFVLTVGLLVALAGLALPLLSGMYGKPVETGGTIV
ncbi:MAG: MFS transporter, partial [Verrucomicrobiota bacterium]|nr:MFS transporter [Verrucomicrobiota bacterium]